MATLAKNIMKENDLVIIYISPANMDMIQLSNAPKAEYHCKFGKYPHSLFLGKQYGSQIWSSDHKGFVHALRPTSQLLTETLAHRTQIIYSTDISLICALLELKNGCTVIESGTGSGSLSTSLARAVLPKGHLYTFEFNKMRAEGAVTDFEKYGLSKYITVTHRDVIQDGFMLPGLEKQADAVFLDLPNPWSAIEHATKVMKNYAHLVNFSPCIEQVQKCVEAMEKYGFIQMKTYECLSRHFDLKYTEFAELKSKKVKENEDKDKKSEIEENKKEEELSIRDIKKKKRKQGIYEKEAEVANPYHTEKGHTGYLTIAVYPGQ